LRFIDAEGKERDVTDVDQLYELIRSGQFNYESLVRDVNSERWVRAHDHELFVRIRKIAHQTLTEDSTSSADGLRQKNLEKSQQDKIKIREPVLVRGPGFRFLVVSICIYVLAVIFSLAAKEPDHRALIALFASPIILPLVPLILIPSFISMWALMGSPFIPLSGVRYAVAQNVRFIIGGVLLTSAIIAGAVSVGSYASH
jgi:hypothetical protein